MSRTAQIRRALSNIAWAYILLHLDFNLGTLNLLPEWAGYALIYPALGLLSGELRDLPLLKPFCVLLGAVSGVDWLAVLFTGGGVTGRVFLLNALINCVALYFHFQLLTGLAILAGREEDGLPLARRLRVCRNLDAVLRVVLLLPLPWEDWSVGYVLLLLFGLGVCVVIARDLFALRARFPLEEPEA